MRLLLDTHILLWALADDPKVQRIAPRLLDQDNEVYFSVASLWEVAIKSGIGKLDASVDEVRRAAISSGFIELPILGAHISALTEVANHHKDPFDRLLVAQANAEPMRLLTADPLVGLYGEQVELI